MSDFLFNIKEANVLSIELNKIGFKSVAAVSGQTSFNQSN